MDFSSRRFEQGTICRPHRNPGQEPKHRACHFIQVTPNDRAVMAALLAAGESDMDRLTEIEDRLGLGACVQGRLFGRSVGDDELG